jgi:hypothetical protein
MRLKVAIVSLVACGCLLLCAPAFAGFGMNSLKAGAFDRNGSVDLWAGSHPYEFRISWKMDETNEVPEGTLRAFVADLPPGMVGNPLAVPRCSGAAFEGQFTRCPGNTQIGVAHVKLPGEVETTSPVYNLTPPFGVPASVGFSLVNHNSFQEASVRPGDFGISISDITVPTTIEILGATETVWGVPADPGHDAERQCISPEGSAIHGCPSDIAPAPFLTLPTSCAAPLKTTIGVESLQEPGVMQSQTVESLGEGGTPEGLVGCEAPGFEPSISAQPETAAADSPTGLHFALHIPQNEGLNKELEGTATAQLKTAAVTLPAGLALNPSTADGLGACSLAQIGLKSSAPALCPAASKVATVKAETPLLDHPVLGSVYIARQNENPFNSLIALYIVLEDPITGVVVKLAGKVEPDPVTGQLRTVFKDNPQLPVEDFDFDFFGGPRATLTTPQTCGTYTTTTALTPWSTPEGADAFPTDSFQITAAANGGACVSNEAQDPNAPSFEAGTATPLAGSYSPFVLKLDRENGSQHLSAISVTMPPGLTGKLAGIAQCSDAQLAAAAARSNPGQGALEQASPSCPASSEVGTVTVGAGSGSPFHAGGHAYLAGPYKGAPFSLAI